MLRTLYFHCGPRPEKVISRKFIIPVDFDYTIAIFKGDFFQPVMELLGSNEWLENSRLHIFQIDEIASKVPFNERNPFSFTKNVTAISISWEFSITVYPFGSGIGSATGKPAYGILECSSSVSFQILQGRAIALVKEKEKEKKNTNHNIKLFMSAELEFTEENFYSNPLKNHNLFALGEIQSYSHIVLANLLSKVEIGFQLGKFTKLADIFDNQTNAFSNNRVTARVDTAWGKLSPEMKTRFEEGLNTTYEHLHLLNSTYEATDLLSEAGRRLIINDIVIATVNTLGVTWEAEKSIFSSEKPGELGWGPLDFFFKKVPQAVVITKASTDDDEVDLAERNAAMVTNVADVDVITEDNGSHVDEFIQAVLSDVEAKKSSCVQGVAQIGAQLYDIAKDILLNDSSLVEVQVRGTLSTGRMWRFFTLVARADAKKALLLFDGQLPLHILKVTYAEEGAAVSAASSVPSPTTASPSLKKARTDAQSKQPSGVYYNYNEPISKDEIENVVKALVATFLASPEPIDFPQHLKW
jgi:hypothetical protein